MITSMAQFTLQLFLEELVVVLCMFGGWLLTTGRWLLAELGYAIIRGKYQTTAPEGATGTGMVDGARRCLEKRHGKSRKPMSAISITMTFMLTIATACYAGLITRLGGNLWEDNEPNRIGESNRPQNHWRN